jgi:thiol-disulfide isomerase/thioredoxin
LEFCVRSLIAILLGAGLILTAGCDRQSADTPQAQGESTAKEGKSSAKPEAQGTLDISRRGEDAPNVKFNAPDGSEVTLASFKGKPVLVNLWATWCGPCVAEMPTLDALAMRQADKLTVLTVSQDMQGKALVDEWWAKRDYKQIAPYLDQENNLGFAFNTGMVPTTVLYDKDGKEIWRVIGGMDWDGPRANTLMAEAVGG